MHAPRGLLLLALLAAAGQSVFSQPATTVSLVVTGGTVVTVDVTRRVIPRGAVAIDGSRIVAVGPAAEIAARFHGRSIIDATGQVVMPGLINTHTHAPMVLYRGLADDLALMEWLQKYIFPAEAKTVTPAFVRAGTRLAALEMIQSGTTTYADMYYFEEEIAAVTKAAGLRGVLGQTVIQFPVADAKTPADALTRAEAFIQKYKDDDLIVPAVAPHALYTNDQATLLAARNLAIKYTVPLLIHLAETEDEVKAARDKGGMSPTGYLESFGFWTGARTLAAHGVWVSPDDITTLVRRGVGVSHNPESNMKLASGSAPVVGYLKAGAALGLGTDGAASNNDLDMLGEMRTAALLAKAVSGDATAVPAHTALRMATLNGAKAMGLDAEIGSLRPGKAADITAIDLSALSSQPVYDPVSQIVYTAGREQVTDVWVAGRRLLANRALTTLDEDAILNRARVWRDKIQDSNG